MDKILVDTNIVIDLLTKRAEFYKPAAKLFALADRGKVKLFITSLTFANTYYLLAKELTTVRTKEVLRKFKLLVKILPVSEKIIDLALNSDFKDFEDAIQYYSALESRLEVIVTRNIKDFKLSDIPAITADDYLKINDLGRSI